MAIAHARPREDGFPASEEVGSGGRDCAVEFAVAAVAGWAPGPTGRDAIFSTADVLLSTIIIWEVLCSCRDN